MPEAFPDVQVWGPVNRLAVPERRATQILLPREMRLRRVKRAERATRVDTARLPRLELGDCRCGARFIRSPATWESGANPELPRSGKWERKPSTKHWLAGAGKRRPVGDCLYR